jgi:hypothetical protein
MSSKIAQVATLLAFILVVPRSNLVSVTAILRGFRVFIQCVYDKFTGASMVPIADHTPYTWRAVFTVGQASLRVFRFSNKVLTVVYTTKYLLHITYLKGHYMFRSFIDHLLVACKYKTKYELNDQN